MKQYHIAASLIACLVVIVAIQAGSAFALSVERQYIYALAPQRFPQKHLGSALQSEAFRHPDLLPLYGSSELAIPDPYHINRIFRLYPTGFAPFLVGNTGAQPLIYLQRLASAGSVVNGKKVIILLSPQFFFEQAYSQDRYAGNFSRLQAYQFAFSTEFSTDLKRQVAKRMLDYPDTVQNDPILRDALDLLANETPSSATLYYALVPLGRLEIAVLELQDHWETLEYIRGQAGLTAAIPRRAGALNWERLLTRAEKSYEQRSNNNPFGFDNLQWEQYGADWIQARANYSEAGFLASLKQSKGWTDLYLLLEVLKEMNSKPLILGIPIPALYADYLGVSGGARNLYYQMLRDAVRPYGMPLEQFEDYEGDHLFFYNPGAHLSSKGWVTFSSAIDAFYHGGPIGGGSGSK